MQANHQVHQVQRMDLVRSTQGLQGPVLVALPDLHLWARLPPLPPGLQHPQACPALPVLVRGRDMGPQGLEDQP